MGVVLVSTFLVEQSNPCRQLRRPIQDRLTSSDELLGSQRPEPSSTLDCPHPRRLQRRERQQAITLVTISADAQLTNDDLALIQHRGHGEPLCGSIPIRNMTNLLTEHRMGTPRRASLK